MTIVIASINIKEGKLPDYLRILIAIVPMVRKEKGCIEYVPAGDIETGLPAQVQDRNAVTILEKGEGLAALNAHLTSPHMLFNREKVKDISTAYRSRSSERWSDPFLSPNQKAKKKKG